MNKLIIENEKIKNSLLFYFYNKSNKEFVSLLRRFLSRYYKKSLEIYLVELGFIIQKCGFCDNFSEIIKLDIIVNNDSLYITNIYYKENNPFSCRLKECPRRKLNPNSIERISKSNNISEDEAKKIIHLRNKSPFYKENHKSIEEFSSWQKRDLNYFVNKYHENGEKRYKDYINAIKYKNSKIRYIDENRENDYNIISKSKAITIKNMNRVHGSKGIEVYEKWKKKVTNTKENFINRYGETEGLKRWEKYINNCSYRMSIFYYIEKYGEKLGKKRWNERKKDFSITLNKMIEKYGELEGKNKYKNFLRNISNVHFNNVSKESWIFFEPIIKFLLKKGFKKEEIKIGTSKRKEYSIFCSEKCKFYYYDFVIPSLKIIIEYNGEMFHPNPIWDKEKWNSWKCLRSNLNADEKFSLDKEKEEYAKKYNYYVIQIYSSDNFDDKYNYIYDLITEKINVK